MARGGVSENWGYIPASVLEVRVSEDNDILTLSEAAALLRVHPVTLRRLAVAWGVPHKRLGAEWRFSRVVLTTWIQQRTV
jgi:excisionase family DNA binding protein